MNKEPILYAVGVAVPQSLKPCSPWLPNPIEPSACSNRKAVPGPYAKAPAPVANNFGASWRSHCCRMQSGCAESALPPWIYLSR